MRILYCLDEDNNSYAVCLRLLCQFVSLAVKCFLLNIRVDAFIFKEPRIWPSMNVISIYFTTHYSVVWMVGRKGRKGRYDNSWFSVSEFTLVPPGSGMPGLHLPPSSCATPSVLSVWGQMVSLCIIITHAKPVGYTLLTLKLGENKAQWTKVICSRELHKAVMEPREKGISWLLPGSIVLSWIKPSRSLILAWSWSPAIKDLASWRRVLKHKSISWWEWGNKKCDDR